MTRDKNSHHPEIREDMPTTSMTPLLLERTQGTISLARRTSGRDSNSLRDPPPSTEKPIPPALPTEKTHTRIGVGKHIEDVILHATRITAHGAPDLPQRQLPTLTRLQFPLERRSGNPKPPPEPSQPSQILREPYRINWGTWSWRTTTEAT